MESTLKSRRAIVFSDWQINWSSDLNIRISSQYHSFGSYFQGLIKYENTRHTHKHRPVF